MPSKGATTSSPPTRRCISSTTDCWRATARRRLWTSNSRVSFSSPVLSFAFFSSRVGLLEVVLGLLVVDLVEEAFLEEGLRAVAAAVRRRHPHGEDVHALLAAHDRLPGGDVLASQVGLQGLQRRALLHEAAPQLGAVDAREELALLHLAAGLDAEGDDALRGAEQRGMQGGDDAALRGDVALEVAADDVGDAHAAWRRWRGRRRPSGGRRGRARRGRARPRPPPRRAPSAGSSWRAWARSACPLRRCQGSCRGPYIATAVPPARFRESAKSPAITADSCVWRPGSRLTSVRAADRCPGMDHGLASASGAGHDRRASRTGRRVVTRDRSGRHFDHRVAASASPSPVVAGSRARRQRCDQRTPASASPGASPHCWGRCDLARFALARFVPFLASLQPSSRRFLGPLLDRTGVNTSSFYISVVDLFLESVLPCPISMLSIVSC